MKIALAQLLNLKEKLGATSLMVEIRNIHNRPFPSGIKPSYGLFLEARYIPLKPYPEEISLRKMFVLEDMSRCSLSYKERIIRAFQEFTQRVKKEKYN